MSREHVDGRSVKRFGGILLRLPMRRKNSISFNEAYTRVRKKYSMLSRDDVRWYLPE
ncbi:MAG: hypothetical protein QW506_00030 [Thermoproteota archaeon]